MIMPVEKGSTVSIHAHLEDEASAQRAFSSLSENGIVISGLTINPPPDNNGISGCVKDRYGFTWIISALKSN